MRTGSQLIGENMQEEAQKVLVELLQKANAGIDSAVSFSQAQIPDVIHELLVWNSVSSIYMQTLGLLIFVAAFSIGKAILTRYAKAKVGDDNWVLDHCYEYAKCISFPAFISIALCGAAVVVGILMVAANFDWLKIWLAPKLYLIEYAAYLIK